MLLCDMSTIWRHVNHTEVTFTAIVTSKYSAFSNISSV